MQSSTSIAIRALVMLIVLISVPLFAIFGKNLPEVVKGLLEGRSLVLGPAAASENVAGNARRRRRAIRLSSRRRIGPRRNPVRAANSPAVEIRLMRDRHVPPLDFPLPRSRQVSRRRRPRRWGKMRLSIAIRNQLRGRESPIPRIINLSVNSRDSATRSIPPFRHPIGRRPRRQRHTQLSWPSRPPLCPPWNPTWVTKNSVAQNSGCDSLAYPIRAGGLGARQQPVSVRLPHGSWRQPEYQSGLSGDQERSLGGHAGRACASRAVAISTATIKF